MLRPCRTPHLMLAVLFVIASGSTMAQQAAPPSGSWSGILHGERNERVRVEANFSAGGISLHFSDPFSCRIDAAFIESASDGINYAFRPSTTGGAFCDKLYPGDLILSPSTDGDLPLSLTNGTVRWSGKLHATSASP